MMRRALDEHGVNFFDAADAYGNGRAERQIAEAFRGRRSEIVIGTKIGYDIYDEDALADAARAAGAADAHRSRVHAHGRRPLSRASRDRLHRRAPDPQREDGARARRRSCGARCASLQREGKIRTWGAAFGPAIGWLYESVELVEREPDINTIQMIWNVLEQHPGSAMIEAARRHAPNCCFNVRVTHASGMLEGKYTEDTVFPENDHRRHRPRSWLVNGVAEGEDARLPHARR